MYVQSKILPKEFFILDKFNVGVEAPTFSFFIFFAQIVCVFCNKKPGLHVQVANNYDSTLNKNIIYLVSPLLSKLLAKKIVCKILLVVILMLTPGVARTAKSCGGILGEETSLGTDVAQPLALPWGKIFRFRIFGRLKWFVFWKLLILCNSLGMFAPIQTF